MLAQQEVEAAATFQRFVTLSHHVALPLFPAITPWVLPRFVVWVSILPLPATCAMCAARANVIQGPNQMSCGQRLTQPCSRCAPGSECAAEAADGGTLCCYCTPRCKALRDAVMCSVCAGEAAQDAAGRPTASSSSSCGWLPTPQRGAPGHFSAPHTAWPTAWTSTARGTSCSCAAPPAAATAAGTPTGAPTPARCACRRLQPVHASAHKTPACFLHARRKPLRAGHACVRGCCDGKGLRRPVPCVQARPPGPHRSARQLRRSPCCR